MYRCIAQIEGSSDSVKVQYDDGEIKIFSTKDFEKYLTHKPLQMTLKTHDYFAE